MIKEKNTFLAKVAAFTLVLSFAIAPLAQAETIQVDGASVELVETSVDLPAEYTSLPRGFLLEVKWGDLDQSVESGVDVTNWDGTLACTNCDFGLRGGILLESHDNLHHDGNKETVTWESLIYSHYDGVLVKVVPQLANESAELSITMNNELLGEKTYSFDELREGVTEELEGGYKVFLKARHPLYFWKRFNANPRLLEIRWGNLEGGYNADDPQIDYEGMLRGNGLEVAAAYPILFEEGDEVTSEAGADYATWQSTVKGHWDGLLVKVVPLEENSDEITSEEQDAIMLDATAEKSLTLTLGDFEKTFTSADEFGRFDLGDGYQVEIKNRVALPRVLAGDLIDRLIKHKIAVLRSLHAIDQAIEDLEEQGVDVSDYDALRDAISDYNFVGDDEQNQEIINKLTELLNRLEESGITDEELGDIIDQYQSMLDALKARVRLKKFALGIIDFKDVDDDVWYHTFVHAVRGRGIIAGYYDAGGKPLGIFKPAQNVSICEMLKVAVKTAEYDVGAATSNYDDVPDWCEPYYDKATELGLTIASADDVTRNATRAEVVRALIEAVMGTDGLDDYTMGTLPPDVSEDHQDALYISFAFEMGIVAGDDDTGNFRPDDSIIRAEVAKIVENTVGLLMTE